MSRMSGGKCDSAAWLHVLEESQSLAHKSRLIGCVFSLIGLISQRLIQCLALGT